MNNQLSYQQKKLLALFIGGVVLLVLLLWLGYFLSSHVRVTLVPSSGETIAIGKTINEAGIDGVFVNTSFKKSLWVKKGDYVVGYGGQDYLPTQSHATIHKNQTFSSPQLDYSPSKLSALSASASAPIKQTINRAVPSTYNIQNIRLYKDATWGGVLVTPQDTSKDLLRAVIHKNANGRWEVVSKWEIILQKASYPNLPTDVVNSVNNQSAT